MQTTTLTHVEYSNPEQTDYLRQLEIDLFSYVELQGEQHGQKNEPRTEAALNALVFNKIEVTIQGGIDDNHIRHQMGSGIAIAKKILSDAKEKIAKLEVGIFDMRHKVAHLFSLKVQLKPDLYKMRSRTLVGYATTLLSIAEGFFGYDAFRHARVPRIPSLFMAVGVAVAIRFLMEPLAGWLLKAKNRVQKILRYCIVLLPAFSFFAVLGYLRANAYNSIINLHAATEQMPTGPAGTVSGWNLTIVSFLFFVAALILAIKYYKTDQEARQEQEYNNTCKEIDAVENTIAENEKLKSSVDADATLQAALALSRYEYAFAIEERLATTARQALEAYKDKNIRFRTDRIPHFFSHPAPFNFTFYFKQFKTNSYEADSRTRDAQYVS